MINRLAVCVIVYAFGLTTDKSIVNIHDLLDGFTLGTSVVSDYISVTTDSVITSNSILSVDVDGAGSPYSFQDVVVLWGITGYSANDLIVSGNVVT